MKKHKIYTVIFAHAYSYYIAKAEKKGRTKKEVEKSSDGSQDTVRNSLSPI